MMSKVVKAKSYMVSRLSTLIAQIFAEGLAAVQLEDSVGFMNRLGNDDD